MIKKTSHNVLISGIFLLLVLIFAPFLLSAQTLNPPQIPCDFAGYQARPQGLLIGDEIITKDEQGNILGEFTVNTNGEFGFLTVPADNPQTPQKDGALEGETIIFYINGVEQEATSIWTAGGLKTLDLGIPKIPLDLIITSPEENSAISANPLALSGEVNSPQALITVTLNDTTYDSQADLSGLFSLSDIILEGGANTPEISALVQSLTLDQQHMLTILGKPVAKSKFLKAESNGFMILKTLINNGILVEYNAGNVFLRINESKQISRPDEIQDRKFDEIWDDLRPHEADDLPVWEINKRRNRYIVKPLIRIENNIFWGPYSIDRTQKNWLGRVMNGDMPFDLQKPKIIAVIEKRKQDIECKIVEHVFGFMKQFTSCIEKELYLHKRDKRSGYPDIGDFDVLAFVPEHNTLLNIECKDLTGGYCPKDSKKLREALFGNRKGDGYIGRVECRETYLKNNLVRIFKTLNWIGSNGQPKVVSWFVSRNHYYWYEFPPYQTDVQFVKASMLKNNLEELIGKKQ